MPCQDSGQWLATAMITTSTRNTVVSRDHDKDNPNLRCAFMSAAAPPLLLFP
ncbi:hypothetical protein I548_5717 [Mycobacterium intracellulare]|nr:hypothetical protein I548_5717 [Mycobacterium intracellulare]